MKTISKQQRGVSFGGFIVIVILFVAVAVFAMKLIPAFMESGKINNAFEAMVRDPAMQNASVAEIRNSFYKRAISMDDVKSVSQDDIEISRENGVLVLSASYSKKIPLAGNVSLLIEFNPTSSK